MTIVFQVIKHTIGLRTTAEEEIIGLDALEHGLESAYADFNQTTNPLSALAAAGVTPSSEGAEAAADIAKNLVPPDVAVPVQVVQGDGNVASDVPMHKVEIICKMDRFELLKHSLESVGITGMTVVNCMGCGVQKGNTKLYRGSEVAINLLPKIKVEVVVASVPVASVITAAKSALYTGNIGDGKIFVYGVDEVVKVRTGEENAAALAGEDQF
jgi:Amt family ammonium transporter